MVIKQCKINNQVFIGDMSYGSFATFMANEKPIKQALAQAFKLSMPDKCSNFKGKRGRVGSDYKLVIAMTNRVQRKFDKLKSLKYPLGADNKDHTDSSSINSSSIDSNSDVGECDNDDSSLNDNQQLNVGEVGPGYEDVTRTALQINVRQHIANKNNSLATYLEKEKMFPKDKPFYCRTAHMMNQGGTCNVFMKYVPPVNVYVSSCE